MPEETVRKIMTPNPVVVLPSKPLLEAAQLLVAKGFSGLPVVDEENRVLGILTEYDLIIQGSSLHLPTFVKLLQEIHQYGRDKKTISAELARLTSLKVQDAMNSEPFTLLDTASVDEVAKAFSEHHRVNPIVVVDTQNRLVGVVSRRDLVRLFGNYTIRYADEPAKRAIDVNVNQFLGGFERKFIVVSRFRTQTWLMFSGMFFVIGFVVAFALIVRVNL